MQRLNGDCYVSAFAMPTSDVKQYFLLRKSAVFQSSLTQKVEGIFLSNWLHFVETKNSFNLNQKHEKFQFPLQPSLRLCFIPPFSILSNYDRTSLTTIIVVSMAYIQGKQESLYWPQC